MRGFVSVYFEAASRLDAICAARAVLPPVNAAELAYAMKTSRSWNGVDVVTIGHLKSLSKINAIHSKIAWMKTISPETPQSMPAHACISLEPGLTSLPA
jgi:hypothetical protein